MLLKEPEIAAPLRRHDCPPITDGAAAVMLAAGDRARELSERPAWIRGIDHRIEAHALGVRDLTTRRRPPWRPSGRGGRRPVDVAELHAPFTHQEVLVRRALGLGDGVEVNPSGGPLAANPIIAAGLDPHRRGRRPGSATARPDRAVAHATSGPCLQQNLVCVLEGEG